MRTLRSLGLAGLLLGLVASMTAAQETDKHRGFWIGVGLGGGWNLSNTINGDTRGGGALVLRMGGSPSERWLIGGEILGFGTSEGGVDFGRGNVTLTVMHYVNVPRGVFLKAGIGGAGFTTFHSSTVGNTTTTVTTKTGRVREFHESVRMYSQVEMIDMLQAAGFVNVQCYGSLHLIWM